MTTCESAEFCSEARVGLFTESCIERHRPSFAFTEGFLRISKKWANACTCRDQKDVFCIRLDFLFDWCMKRPVEEDRVGSRKLSQERRHASAGDDAVEMLESAG
jgi:hypothetical protein